MGENGARERLRVDLTFVDVGREAADEHLPREALIHFGALRLRRRSGRRAEGQREAVDESAALLRDVIFDTRKIRFACKRVAD